MARIDQKLIEALKKKSGLSQTAVYARIQKIAQRDYLSNDLAAVKLGAELGVPVNRFAKELAQLRASGSPVAPPPSEPIAAAVRAGRPVAKGKKPASARKTKNEVFVVHGRDDEARKDMFAFLRALGIRPIEWSEALKASGKPSPYIGEVLDAAFKRARAIVVLMTPDDMAVLRQDLQKPSDPPFEKNQTGQARPNVLFEAGMAFGTHPDRVVLVELGSLRKFSDVAGRHVVNMTNSTEKRMELALKLENAGCDVNRDGTDWISVGDFEDPLARTPKAARKASKKRRSY